VNGFTVNLGDISNTIIVDYSTRATDGGFLNSIKIEED
jgi:hypothetical protein